MNINKTSSCNFQARTTARFNGKCKAYAGEIEKALLEAERSFERVKPQVETISKKAASNYKGCVQQFNNKFQGLSLEEIKSNWKENLDFLKELFEAQIH